MPASYLRASTLAALFVVAASFGPVRAQAQNGFSEARNANIDISGARSARIESVRSAGGGGITHDTVKGIVSIPERKRRGT